MRGGGGRRGPSEVFPGGPAGAAPSPENAREREAAQQGRTRRELGDHERALGAGVHEVLADAQDGGVRRQGADDANFRQHLARRRGLGGWGFWRRFRGRRAPTAWEAQNGGISGSGGCMRSGGGGVASDRCLRARLLARRLPRRGAAAAGGGQRDGLDRVLRAGLAVDGGVDDGVGALAQHRACWGAPLLWLLWRWAASGKNWEGRGGGESWWRGWEDIFGEFP